MRRTISIAAMALTALSLLPGVGEARRDPWQVGPHILIAIPMDDFENVSGIGGGLAVRSNYEFSDVFSIRGDAAYLSYGRKLESLDFGPNIGFLPAETTSQGYRLALGPQVSFQGRGFLVYLSSQAGSYLFRTSIAVPGTTYSDSRDNNWALGWSNGLGVQFDVGFGPWLDIGAQYQTIYDLPGQATQNPDDPEGAPIPGPNIDAQELTLEFGVHFFLTK